MIGLVLVSSGLVVAATGAWRSYGFARHALAPFVRDGDPTRRLIDATRPVHDRWRTRAAARSLVLAVGWLCLAMYGLYLVTVGTAVIA